MTRSARSTLYVSSERSVRPFLAAGLLLAVAGGRLDGTPVDLYPAPIPARTVGLRDARLAHVLGMAVPRADAERALTALGCVVLPREGRLTVQVPSWHVSV